MVGRDGRPQSNPDFDAEMHDAAMLLHKKMERQVRLGKKPDGYIESPEYFADIMAEMQANFPDAFEDSEPAPAPTRRTPPMGTPRQPVAPATRGAPAASAKTQKITLDGETASFVRGLVDNGTMRYPRSHPDVAKRGQPMEYNDAYKEYARQRQMQPQQSQN
ncbi:MAG: hypothetical protein EBX60_03720 [Betaproteobacteria bacterium]|nr:hypothetical protein [Betaproteobacteria bacterium]